MWWFLHKAYQSRYVNLAKTQRWPLEDWKRLANVPAGRQRALVLLRTWDSEMGQKTAKEWLDALSLLMTHEEAPPPLSRRLMPRDYPAPNKHTRAGDIILWSSTLA
jgi:hypothetical protein